VLCSTFESHEGIALHVSRQWPLEVLLHMQLQNPGDLPVLKISFECPTSLH
jgi:hypothetical protein